jgi:hypothetical protein
MSERKLKTGDRAKRPNRVPISGQRDLITVDGKDPDFEYRIVKEKPGRIDKFLNAGYEVVTHEVEVGDKNASRDVSEGSPVKLNLGRGEVGYLMRVPREFYLEDQQAKEDELQAREADMLDKAKSGHYGRLDIKRGSQP